MADICIMSFNIRNACDTGTEAWECRKDNLLGLIINADPDLIGMQEVLHHQYVDLADNLHHYNSVGVGREDGLHAGEYAAIFYKKDRFALMESGTFWLSETPDRPSLGWDADCIRICTYARLLDNKTQKELIHLNTHLDHVGKKAMLEGAKLIRKNMLEKGLPAFVTGDFNVAEGSEPYHVMVQAGLSDAKFTAKSSMSHGTFHDYHPTDSLKNESPIDYLFYTDNDFSIEEYKVLINGREGAYTSDHYPIQVMLTQR